MSPDLSPDSSPNSLDSDSHPVDSDLDSVLRGLGLGPLAWTRMPPDSDSAPSHESGLAPILGNGEVLGKNRFPIFTKIGILG